MQKKANRIAGTCYVRVGGEQITVGGSISADLKMETKESVTGLNRTAGYKAQAFTPFVEVEAITVSEMDINKLTATNDAAITIELANGWVGELQHAWLVGDAEVNPADGNVTLRFEGKRGVWRT